jgi:hypothetical protein
MKFLPYILSSGSIAFVETSLSFAQRRKQMLYCVWGIHEISIYIVLAQGIHVVRDIGLNPRAVFLLVDNIENWI